MEKLMNLVNEIKELDNIDILLIMFFCKIEHDRRINEIDKRGVL